VVTMDDGRTCAGRGARGPCRRRPRQDERFCAFHADQAVVSLHGDRGSGRMAVAVAETLSELPLEDVDAAIVRLAERYASVIDAAANPYDALDKFGPKLRAALESLGATPQARARTLKGAAASEPSGALARLRAARSD
jgi:hypothetical protein